MNKEDILGSILLYSIKFKVLTVIIGLLGVYTIVRLIQYSDLKQYVFYIFIPAILISLAIVFFFLRSLFTKKLGDTLIYTFSSLIFCIVGLGYIELFNPNKFIV